MATKVKGICKYISSVFVVKEREMEIGCPTDVKHVAHIGWEGPTRNAPTWMKAFKSGPEYAATSMNHSASTISPWSSQEATRQQKRANVYRGIASSDVASPPRKHRRRKHHPKSTNSSSSSPSTLRSSRPVKSKVAKSGDQDNPKPPAAIEVS